MNSATSDWANGCYTAIVNSVVAAFTHTHTHNVAQYKTIV